ncbi:Hypothetical predicted protein, partial [Pelobates cultripes]
MADATCTENSERKCGPGRSQHMAQLPGASKPTSHMAPQHNAHLKVHSTGLWLRHRS